MNNLNLKEQERKKMLWELYELTEQFNDSSNINNLGDDIMKKKIQIKIQFLRVFLDLK